MSARGLPGRRLDAMRAGIRIRVEVDAICTDRSFAARHSGPKRLGISGAFPQSAAFIRVARAGANRYSPQRAKLARNVRSPPSLAARQNSLSGLGTARENGLLRTQQNSLGALLGTCLFLLVMNIAASAIFTPPKLAKPGFDIAVQEAPSEAAKGPAEPPQADRRAARQRQRREGRRRREEVPRLPHLREGRREQGWPQPLSAWSSATRVDTRASTIQDR